MDVTNYPLLVSHAYIRTMHAITTPISLSLSLSMAFLTLLSVASLISFLTLVHARISDVYTNES